MPNYVGLSLSESRHILTARLALSTTHNYNCNNECSNKCHFPLILWVFVLSVQIVIIVIKDKCHKVFCVEPSSKFGAAVIVFSQCSAYDRARWTVSCVSD